MQNVNVVALTGNLTSEPELRTLDSGTKVANMRIAVNGRRRTADGSWIDTVGFFNVAVFGPQAERCDRHLTRGRPVAIQGRLDWREVGKGDEHREYVKVIAEQIQFLGPKPDAGETAGEEPEAEPAQEELPAAA